MVTLLHHSLLMDTHRPRNLPIASSIRHLLNRDIAKT
jgi:hypothetical protein